MIEVTKEMEYCGSLTTKQVPYICVDQNLLLRWKILKRSRQKNQYIFQLLMYAILKTRSEDIDQLMLGVYPLKSTAGKYELIHDLRADKDDYLQKFSAILIDIIERIFDKDQAFEQTSDQDICKYCDYKGICGR